MTAGRLTEDVYARIDASLAASDARVAAAYPGEPAGRQPVHTVYVPAGRYHAGLAGQWGTRALDVLTSHELPATDDVLARVRTKLASEPIEDLRIDFEDGYGNPGDDVEDAEVVRCGRELASEVAGRGDPDSGPVAPFCGIRFKSFEVGTRRRGMRTLDLFLEALGGPPPGFVVTLPKVTDVDQVTAAADVLSELEKVHGLAVGTLRFEVQVETTQSVLRADGTVALPAIVQAANGRCSGLHFGTYDYSASLGIAGAYQSMDHPAADFAKQFMQVAAAGRGVRLSDGSTNRLPVGEAVADGWAEHLRLVRRSLERGFYQGWDLHPHQLPSRFAATYAFFRENLTSAADRLRAYVGDVDGAVLDEPATAQALATYVLRGLDCGAVDETELDGGLDRRALSRLAARAG
ncbi:MULTISPECIES: DUF6986 family protein [Prauserella salsuginis group]|uniref:Citrate lyase beta subunit n=2 Tax=Prauserella salsuginis group TaxID=2893672 RepID=A0A839XF95_9PSEU|nr:MULTISPECIES: aldolase/citrate lyase family protein [Prauserella salsuginis group]MBB3661431.1 citrate lyase beta subunit [Prauserella sediminis]MCR3719352.1 HpcH/HpaI aldolase/citrate lyase family protein [Prauserella flava]MCR3735634.1 HpcH/HpaI aldolase/citrate lyase family protein [Prauserella salsuginis]